MRSTRKLVEVALSITVLFSTVSFAQSVEVPQDASKLVSDCRREIDAKHYDTMSDVCEQEVRRLKEAGVAPGVYMALDVVRAAMLSQSSAAWQQRLDRALQETPPADNARLAGINMNLGSALMLEKAPQAAIAPLTRALSFGPDALDDKQRAETVAWLADALLLSGQYKQAAQLLESQVAPDGAAVPMGRRLSLRKAEAYLGLLSDPANERSEMRQVWLQRRWMALESAVGEGLASRVSQVTPKGEVKCILPSADSLPGGSGGRRGLQGKAAVDFVLDAEGSLTDAQLASSSGNDRLNERSVKVIKHAQCRPNPALIGMRVQAPFISE